MCLIEMEPNLVLNWTNFNFFVKKIKTRNYRNPKVDFKTRPKVFFLKSRTKQINLDSYPYKRANVKHNKNICNSQG